MYLAIMIYDKDSIQTDSHSTIGDGISISIAKPCIKWVEFIWEQTSYVLEGSNLEHLRLSVYDFTLERAEKTIRT